MKAQITRFDEELVIKARQFVKAAAENPDSRAVLTKYGYADEEHRRGEMLIRNTERAFEWERDGRAWNFLSSTAERRRVEAMAWYADTRRRYMRDCFRTAEEASGFSGDRPPSKWAWPKKATVGIAIGLGHALRAMSPSAYREHRAELALNLTRAAGQKPEDAPPPKDTALVELSGWYERWRLLAQRLFRERPDMMTPYGLTPGKAPPRLRSRSAQVKFGEKAGGSLLARRAIEEPEAPEASCSSTTDR